MPEPGEKKNYGSSGQAFFANTLLAFTGVGVMPTFTPLATGLRLNPILKGILITASVITAALIQIPAAKTVEKNGGIKEMLAMQAVGFIGMSTLTALSATMDLTKVDSFGWVYLALLADGLALGISSGPFAGMINVVNWCEKESDIPIKQAAFGAIVDASNAITPVVIYALKDYGYVPVCIYSASLLFGGVGGLILLRPPLYHQLRKEYPPEEAKERAIALGQLPSLIHTEEINQTWRESFKEFLTTLCNSRGITLNLMFAITLGGVLGATTTLPGLIKDGFNVSETEAIISASIASLIALSSRSLSGLLIAKLDNTGGVKIYCAGATLSMVAAVPLAFFDLERWQLDASVATMMTGFGMAMVPPFSLAYRWSKPSNKNLQTYRPAVMAGTLSTLGTLACSLLSLALGILVESRGKSGYQDYFILIIALLASSIFAAIATHRQVNRTQNFGTTNNFFPSINQVQIQQLPAPPNDNIVSPLLIKHAV